MARRTTSKKVVSFRKSGRTSVASLKDEILTRDEWLRLAAQGSQLGLWYWDEVNQALFCDRKTREIFGVNLEGDAVLQTFFDAIHPDDRARVEQVWRHELQTGRPYELLYRARHPDGSIRWINARGSGFYDAQRKPLYMIGVVFDVTERKEAERERVELSGRLINAQERERQHLAREIHDDFCQRFALLSLKFDAIAESIDEPQTRAQLDEQLAALAALGADIQHFSHRLHSSKLDVLGLVPSIESLCNDMARERGIRIGFVHSKVPAKLPPGLPLCLFRIVQEGLQNIMKHSGASSAEVAVKAIPGGISLTLSDNGKGFDPGAGQASDGIGIQSMRERTRMFHGQLRISSRPAFKGTRIEVTIPFLRETQP